jgi:hypothetical protein
MGNTCVLRTFNSILEALCEEEEGPACFCQQMMTLDLLDMQFVVLSIFGQCLAIQPAICGHQN